MREMHPFMLLLSLIFTVALALNNLNENHLVWHDISNAFNRGALCNDFSAAGYFIRKNQAPQHQLDDLKYENGSGLLPESILDAVWLDWFEQEPNITSQWQHRKKWIIYLEGGGGCTSPKSCNERFIEQQIRNKFTRFVNGSLNVDVAGAWAAYQNRPLVVTSRLMASLSKFANFEYAGVYWENLTASSKWGVKGRTLLSTSQDENPDFYQHNHVLVPYCSSDLWLKKTNDYKKALSKDFLFQFDPLHVDSHQFTFRGAAIFRSMVRDLFQFHGLSHAEEVILAGSSAGGVGAMNHAKWLKEELWKFAEQETKLYVVLDSAWFIDFRGEITNQFPPEQIQPLVATNEILDNCFSLGAGSGSGGPLSAREDGVGCISAPLFLPTSKFPADVPILVIFSRYDLYLLVQSIASTVSFLKHF